jgi:hypothetical protein
MCAATVENGLVDFEQVETPALTGFPSQTPLSEEKNLLRRKQSLLAHKFMAVTYDGETVHVSEMDAESGALYRRFLRPSHCHECQACQDVVFRLGVWAGDRGSSAFSLC